ncbi:MAG TPA: precorrin-8X methylmutase [Nitrososphaeraceae archaeon]|nr:precorrin-8X methylmutase [Nitrososphaeraceae archaeon]
MSKEEMNENAEKRSMSFKSFDIEKTSFEIIDKEVGTHSYDQNYEWNIVRRVIHATADFDFANKERLLFNNDAIKFGFQAIENKCNVITDVEMVRSGISKNSLTKLNLKCICNISNINVIDDAKKFNKTRAEMAMRNLAEEMNGSIIVIGNAPTALFEVIKMIKEKIATPSLVIGVPVGFVSAIESKIELSKTSIPNITNIGRKGGSSVACSIINALMLLYLNRLQ